MIETHWPVTLERGFLVAPDPLADLHTQPGLNGLLDRAALRQLESLLALLARHLHDGTLRQQIERLPLLNLTRFAAAAPRLDYRFTETLWRHYTYAANAYIFAAKQPPTQRLPASIAVPLHQLAEIVQRPPILSYASLVLNNWRRIDPDGPVERENLAVLQDFTGLPDEHGFVLTHVHIEAAAAPALISLRHAITAAERGDPGDLMRSLGRIRDSLAAITRIFHRITDVCDPDVYHRTVRLYMYGFQGIVFEGVAARNNQPQTFAGGSGAQSSVIPAVIAALGVRHERSDLTRHLDRMQGHMPVAHRDFIAQMTTSAVRDAVQCSVDANLHDAYNQVLRQLITFRRAHYHYARVYIFDKIGQATGTGGTDFMTWLDYLIAETEAQLIRDR